MAPDILDRLAALRDALDRLRELRRQARGLSHLTDDRMMYAFVWKFVMSAESHWELFRRRP